MCDINEYYNGGETVSEGVEADRAESDSAVLATG